MWPSPPLLPHQQKASLYSTLIWFEQISCPSHHTSLNDLQQMCIRGKVTALVLPAAGEVHSGSLAFLEKEFPHKMG